MRRFKPPSKFRVMDRLDNTAGVSFGRSVSLGLGMAVFVLLITLMTHAAGSEQPWYDVDLMPLGAAEVIGALAAVATGTIALQVMAQTSYSRESRTLAEFNHRQNMAILALSSPVVTCLLAVFVWLDKDIGSSTMLI